MCRNLTRIAASVGSAAMVGLMSGQIQGGGSGILDLLMKAAAHPSIGICGMALDVLSQLVPLEPGFPLRLLPVLQHRAIVPHIFAEGAPTILAAELCGVDFHEFERFRENTLTEALQACFHQNPVYYLDSCTSAIEEFCMAEATVEVSFQLEAALYCLSAVSLEVLVSQKNEMKSDNGQAQPGSYDSQLSRCTHALGQKPVCITANPLTLAQLNRFLRQVRTPILGPRRAKQHALTTALSLLTVRRLVCSGRQRSILEYWCRSCFVHIHYGRYSFCPRRASTRHPP